MTSTTALHAPCIITVAITGSVPTKKDDPAVPITVDEQIESTHAAYEAGGSLVHVHVRNDDGSTSSDPERFEDNVRFDKQRLAASNAELVARVADLTRAYGRSVATPTEAREILGLPPFSPGV